MNSQMTAKMTARLTALSAVTLCLGFAPIAAHAQTGQTITGKAAFADYTQQKPGVRRKLTVADLPEPKPEESVDNGAHLVPRPEGAWPIAPAGFKVEIYAQGFTEPRIIRTAPNGDLFVADSKGGAVKILRGVGADGKAKRWRPSPPASDHPFGIAFYPAGPNPKYVYVANTTTLVRFAYKSGDLKATARPRCSCPICPATPNSAAADTGPAMSSSPPTANACSSPSAPPQTSTTPTPRRSSTAPTCSNTHPRASS